MKIKSKEVMKRTIRDDMERSIYLQMPLFKYHHLLHLLYSPSHLNALLAAKISLISFCFIVLKRNYFISIVSSFKYLYGFCFVKYDSEEMYDFQQSSKCKVLTSRFRWFGRSLIRTICTSYIALKDPVIIKKHFHFNYKEKT